MAQFKVKGILSFPHLFEARSVQEGDSPKFGCTVLIADTDPQLPVILQLQEQAKLDGFPSGFPATGKIFCKPSAELPGYHQISGNANADKKPHLVDAAGTPVMDRATVFAGAEAWVVFNSFTYNKPVNKGVSAGLNGVMITGVMGALGRLDGMPSAESMFADLVNGAAPVVAAPVVAAPVVAAPVAPNLLMTAAAGGATLEQYRATPGWTDQMLLDQGLAILASF